ncbi:MAG: Uma2 family endonuclease [Cyanobacteria bacterium SBLK]|nr:Uma2 family endonuclease [Cyanobacteria bacterium SBLK]
MTAQLLRKKFTVSEFCKMAETGIFSDEDNIELIEGEIVEMGKIGRRHAAYCDRLNDLFRDKFAKQVLLRVQSPIELNNLSQPQPDLALLRRREDYYESGHPQPHDIFLLVEVADTTIDSDREIKIPLYGKNGILETWLIDINAQCLEVYRDPSSQGYQSTQKLRRGQSIASLIFPTIAIEVNEIMG